MPNTDEHGFLLMGVAVGVVVSAVIILTIMYTMGMRGWGLEKNQASWPAQLLGASWVLFVTGGGIYLSSLCADVFPVGGTLPTAQTAGMRFGLICVGIGTISLFTTAGLIAWRRRKPENSAARRGKREGRYSLPQPPPL